MRVRHEVTAIHPERKTVSVRNLDTGAEFEESYDKLILSPGAKPTQPRLPGVGLEKLFTLRTVEDTFRIRDYIDANHPRSAVLAGGGFIGLELAYAPPYSSAKDPVNMAGFMVENLDKGLVKQFRIEDVPSLPRDGSVTLLDTRTAWEYAQGHVEGFRNIPVDELRERLGEIEAGKPVYVICQSGLRSYIACRILAGHGYEAYNFTGGFRYYDAVVNDRRLIEQATACGMDHFITIRLSRSCFIPKSI